MTTRREFMGSTLAATALTAAGCQSTDVSVKLSAAPNFSLQPYPFRDLTPHIKRLFEA